MTVILLLLNLPYDRVPSVILKKHDDFSLNPKLTRVKLLICLVFVRPVLCKKFP